MTHHYHLTNPMMGIEAQVYRWLVLASVALALLFIGGIAGDVFFVHHHLDIYSLTSSQESDYSVGYLSSLTCLSIILCGARTLWATKRQPRSKVFNEVVKFFCSWHNSAYDEGCSIEFVSA
jgi:uncharacterized membrane protein